MYSAEAPFPRNEEEMRCDFQSVRETISERGQKMIYLMLAISIILEVIGTSLIKMTNGFTNLPITGVMLLCYAISFFLLSQVVKVLPVGIVYATWSAGGIILVSAAAYFLYKQALDLPAIVGIALIVVGVVLINGFSKMGAH